MREKLSLPKDWEIKNFEDVCELIGGSQPSKDEFIFEPKEGYIRLIQVRDYRTDKFRTFISKEKAKKLCSKEDIMIGRYGPPIFGIFKGLEGAYNVALMKAKVNERICDRDYFFLFLKTDKLREFVEHSSKRAAGQDGVRKELLDKYPVPLPPLSEQKRIVSILDEAFAAIAKAKANAEQNLKNAKELFESYLQGVFENKGEGWEEKRLKDVCELKSGTTISPSLERTEGDVLYTKVADMNLSENLIEINTSSRFVNSREINKNQIIPQGAIVFPKRGGAIATNKKRKIIKPTIVDLNTMAITPGRKIDKDYFFFWFQLIDLNDISNGTSIPQINNYSFDNVFIPYPTSLKEQQAIVKKLDALSAETKKLEAIYQKKIEDLEELKKAVLGKAFRGELVEREVVVG